MTVSLDLTALAAIGTFLGVTGTAVLWAFRRVSDVEKTARMTRLLARALRIPDDSPDDEVIAIMREAFGFSQLEDTGQHPVVRPARRPALRVHEEE